ncbi:MAG: alpha/beta hydrolase [Pseudomonadota bacterium]
MKSYIILMLATLALIAASRITAAENKEEVQLVPIEFDELPEAVRLSARREFTDQSVIGVEKETDAGRLYYHVMFDVDGTEAGLRMSPKGEILDSWHFPAGETTLRPTHEDVEYGPHDRNVFDLWLAESEKPTPLLICIHGGGFSGGDKSGIQGDAEMIRAMLDAGISVAAINYRLTEGGKNAYPIPMRDGARAVQFLRHRADRYNLDKNRFGAMGGSAGGCMLMWLGFHPDLSRQDHKDPVVRESSRLQVLAPFGGQSCLHIPTLENWFCVASLPLHPAYRPLFGLSMEGPIEWSADFDASMRDASPITHLTTDDPPIYLIYEENRPMSEKPEPDVWVHHRIMGTKLKDAMQKLRLECHVEYPGGPRILEYSSQREFLIRKLMERPEPHR